MKLLKETLFILLGFASLASSLPTPSPAELFSASALNSRVIDPPQDTATTGGTTKPIFNFKALLAFENNKPNGGCPNFRYAATPFNGKLGVVPDSVKGLTTVSSRTICPTARSDDGIDLDDDRGTVVESR